MREVGVEWGSLIDLCPDYCSKAQQALALGVGAQIKYTGHSTDHFTLTLLFAPCPLAFSSRLKFYVIDSLLLLVT